MTETRFTAPAARQEPSSLPPLVSPKTVHIRPVVRRLSARDFFSHWSLVRVIALRDFKVKFKQSLLGPAWLVFQPLALLGTLVLAFGELGQVSTGEIPFVLFALVGLSVWTFVQAALSMGSSSMVSNLHLVRRSPAPRWVFPVASMLATSPSLGLTLVAALVFAGTTGELSPRAVLLPVAILWLALLLLGLAFGLAALTVRYRDVISALPFLLQLGVFVTPIAYPPSALSGTGELLLAINPFTGLLEVWRWMVLVDATPNWLAAGVSGGMTAIIAVLGWRLFTRLETTMADDI